jgi:hypothetical protein
MIPRLMLDFSNISQAVGADPFIDGEHKTSWQPHNHNKTLQRIRKFIDDTGGQALDFSLYKSISKFENMSSIPQKIILPKRVPKSYRFAQVGVHEIEQLDDKFDLLYCKAIEHIHDWKKTFESISKISKKGSILYFKHRPFFSYLGAHRYASVGIPWGHILLNDDEYIRFVNQHHKGRSREMTEFFLQGLAYPRYTISDMLRIAQLNNFIPISVRYDSPKYINQSSGFINEVDSFWDIVWENYPRVSAEEIMCGMAHIVFKKIN